MREVGSPAMSDPLSDPVYGEALQHPRIRTGTSFRELNGGAVYMSGPETDAFILDEGTATVLEACDGRSLAELSEGLQNRYGWELPPADLAELLEAWAKLGYLEGTPVRPRRPVRFDPSGLLRLLKPIQRLYGKPVTFAASLTLAALGLALTLLRGPEVVEELTAFRQFHPVIGPILTILGYYLGYSFTAFFHELGHALAVRRFEGEVPEIGIQRNTNFYVLANREILDTSQARIWYYGGGLLSDTVWWVIAWVWWMTAPGPIPLFLLVPQTVYFLVFAYAPSGNSDMAKILKEAFGWKALSRPGKKGWFRRWGEAPNRQRAVELLRLAIAGLLVIYVGSKDIVLIGLYAVYRLARKGLNRI